MQKLIYNRIPKEIKLKLTPRDEEEPSLFEMFKWGKRPHGRPLNKLRLKIKLKDGKLNVLKSQRLKKLKKNSCGNHIEQEAKDR